VVVWLRNSLVVLVFMTETSEALNQQTEKLQTKEIEGQTVVLGPGFENSYQPEYLDNSEAMDLIKKENQESKYGMNKVNYNDIEVEDLPTDGIINKIKRYLGMEEEKEKQIIKARPGQQFDKDNVPTEDVKIEKVEKPVEEDIETPIIPKEKPDEIRSGDFLGVTEFEDRFNNPRKTHEEKYVKAFKIAMDLLTGKIKDNTRGALYFNKDPMSGGKKYGEHYFYVDPYKAR